MILSDSIMQVVGTNYIKQDYHDPIKLSKSWEQTILDKIIMILSESRL